MYVRSLPGGGGGGARGGRDSRRRGAPRRGGSSHPCLCTPSAPIIGGRAKAWCLHIRADASPSSLPQSASPHTVCARVLARAPGRGFCRPSTCLLKPLQPPPPPPHWPRTVQAPPPAPTPPAVAEEVAPLRCTGACTRHPRRSRRGWVKRIQPATSSTRISITRLLSFGIELMGIT